MYNFVVHTTNRSLRSKDILETFGEAHLSYILSPRFISQLNLHTLGARVLCNTIPGLVGRQKRLCRMHPDLMLPLGEGARMGVEECQHHFRNQRWNCSTVNRDASLFGRVMLRGEEGGGRGRDRDRELLDRQADRQVGY